MVNNKAKEIIDIKKTKGALSEFPKETGLAMIELERSGELCVKRGISSIISQKFASDF